MLFEILYEHLYISVAILVDLYPEDDSLVQGFFLLQKADIFFGKVENVTDRG